MKSASLYVAALKRDVPKSSRMKWAAMVLSAGIAISTERHSFLPLPGSVFPAKQSDTLTGGAFFEQLNERVNAMNANTRMFTIAVLASTLAAGAWAQELGRVHFQTSCTPQAQEKFDRALAMVHSFVYPDSVQAFTDVAAADPQCAIAYWGIAISHRPNPMILPLTTTVLKNGLEAVEKGKAIGARARLAFGDRTLLQGLRQGRSDDARARLRKGDGTVGAKISR